jgi:hypothetical protein
MSASTRRPATYVMSSIRRPPFIYIISSYTCTRTVQLSASDEMACMRARACRSTWGRCRWARRSRWPRWWWPACAVGTTTSRGPAGTGPSTWSCAPRPSWWTGSPAPSTSPSPATRTAAAARSARRSWRPSAGRSSSTPRPYAHRPPWQPITDNYLHCTVLYIYVIYENARSICCWIRTVRDDRTYGPARVKLFIRFVSGFFFISSAFSPLPILQMVNVYEVINTNVHSWLACIVRPVILGHAWVQIAKLMYLNDSI